MKLKFCGAAQTVTGSAHLLTLDNGFTILFDCGLYQGNDKEHENFNETFLFDPKKLDCVILSHAHIDHSGRLPKLIKDGFKGQIYSTHATHDLCSIMLMDSAYIQERDAYYENKRKKSGPKIKALYNIDDVQETMQNFVSVGYNRWLKINEECAVLFRDAGHILGSSNVTLKIKKDNYHDTYFGFTGDIGRPDRPILKDPKHMPDCDYIICESTYGGQSHQSAPKDEQSLLDIITHTCLNKKGKLIIPAFSIGRTQEIVHMLDKLANNGKLPRIPVFVDSPLAIDATEIFRVHPDCFDKKTLAYMQTDPNPFGFSNLRYVRDVEASKKLNHYEQPCIIISASGMMQAGRVKHHIFNSIENEKNTLLVVGYCSPSTLGGYLKRKPKKVKIFGEELDVKIEILEMHSFSAHGDQQEMIDFLSNQNRKKLKKIFLTHGEIDRQEIFKKALLENDFREVHIPELGETVKL